MPLYRYRVNHRVRIEQTKVRIASGRIRELFLLEIALFELFLGYFWVKNDGLCLPFRYRVDLRKCIIIRSLIEIFDPKNQQISGPGGGGVQIRTSFRLFGAFRDHLLANWPAFPNFIVGRNQVILRKTVQRG